jgi:hypothetical protein
VVRTIRISPADIIPNDQLAAMEGEHLGVDCVRHLTRGGDYDVIKPDGSLLLALRHNRIPADVCDSAYLEMRRAARPTFNRGAAAGKITQADVEKGLVPPGSFVRGTRYWRPRRDGTFSRTTYAKMVLSGQVGFTDRSPRYPHCRLTEHTPRDVEGSTNLLRYVRAVNDVYRQAAPLPFEVQRQAAARTHDDFLFPGTAITTLTVNKEFRTALHVDDGDLPGAFCVVSALRRGKWGGCYLVYPGFGVAVDLHDGDVLCCDPHSYHCNTPFQKIRGIPSRIAVVCYFRGGMTECGSLREEWERAKRLEDGDYPR